MVISKGIKDTYFISVGDKRVKLFRIDLDNVGYDDYDSCIVIAESKEQVEEMCIKNEFPDDVLGNSYCFDIHTRNKEWFENERPDYLNRDIKTFEEWDKKINQHYTITEIKLEDIKEPVILCSSYNAG